MAYLEVSAFKKLKAFFWGLKQSNFNLNKVPIRDNVGTPIDKAYCLNLLHSFPDFQGEKFKDDNFLVKYLSKSSNLKQILDQFTPEQQIELTKTLEEKPIAVEGAVEQPAEAAAVPVGAPVGEPAATMAGGGYLPSFPSAPSIHNVPRAPKLPSRLGGKEGGTGEGIAATNKAAGLGERYLGPATNKFAKFQREYIGPATAKAARAAGSKAGLFFQRNVGKYLTVGRAATGIGAVIGGFAGATFGSPGVLAGAIGGAAFPSWVKSGGVGRFFGKVGNGVINFGARLSNQVGKGGLKLAGPKKKIWLLFLGSFLLFGLAAGLLGALNPGGSPTGTGTTAGILPSNISQCKFKRDQENPKEAMFKSQKLLGYFNEVATKTGVPAVLLAAISRVEVPSSVNWTDQEVDSQCPVNSGTQAAGIMQIVPHYSHRTDAYCGDCVKQGASYIGKRVEELTAADYCNSRNSIYLGAGFILKKLQLAQKLGDGTRWDSSWLNKDITDKIITNFYGCLLYGGSKECTGPYNYGDDVSTSIQNCKPTTAIAIPPAPVSSGPPPTAADTSQAKQIIADKWKIRIDDSLSKTWELKYLQWIIEKFTEFEQTHPNFIRYIQNERIELIVCPPKRAGDKWCGPNQLSGHVQMTEINDKNVFITTLTHELGHAIYHHRSVLENLQTRHNVTWYREGGATSYGAGDFTENYADMIAYCINGSAVGTLLSQERWNNSYVPIASKVTGGVCK